MNYSWADIKRSLESEFKRLDLERERQLKEDEKLADFLVRKFEEVQQDSEKLKYITFDTEMEIHKKLKLNEADEELRTELIKTSKDSFKIA